MHIVQRIGDAIKHVIVSPEEYWQIQAARMPHKLPFPMPEVAQKGRALIHAIKTTNNIPKASCKP